MATLRNDDTLSQCKAIAQDLKAGRKITPIDALHAYGCFRLGARIFDLRNQGMSIKTTIVQVGRKRVAQYWIA